ncbi:peptidoglycan-binding domain-containing protein [Streptomyces broussonetiae]|uniref:peptidoglycan-binding domain-containing protein n=1 Tax=Streptomyces broussonetiae TaxID=2686304 RepID=UPI0035DDF3F9
MGPLFQFPNFQTAAAAENWLTMARECKMTEVGNPGVIPRNVRNGLLFTLAGWNTTPPPGDPTQLVFDSTQKLDANLRSGKFPVPINLLIGIQTALENLGFDPHGLDGVFGSGTRTALTSFQEANGLALTPGASGVDEIPQQTVDALAAQLDNKGFSHFP